MKSLKELSNDRLRECTDELRKEIKQNLEGYENEIRMLREKAEAEDDVYKKEEIYNNIDKIEKEINVKLEVILDQMVPKAFAIIKETAKRFKENRRIGSNCTTK